MGLFMHQLNANVSMLICKYDKVKTVCCLSLVWLNGINTQIRTKAEANICTKFQSESCQETKVNGGNLLVELERVTSIIRMALGSNRYFRPKC